MVAATKTTTPTIERVPLSQLLAKRHPNNPKEHDLPELIESFNRFGFIAFPTLDETSDVLVAGHGRCEALSSMKERGDNPPAGITQHDGDWLVPVVRGVTFTNERERDAYIIADNQHVMAGGWSFDKLSDWVRSFGSSASDDSFRGLGLPTAELDSLLGNFAQPAAPQEVDEEDSGQHGETVSNDIDVTLNVTCPNCSHAWSVTKPKKKRGVKKKSRSLSLKNGV